MYYLALLYYKVYSFGKFLGHKDPKQYSIMVAPLPFVMNIITIINISSPLLKEDMGLVVILIALFGTIFLYWFIFKNKFDTIIENFDKDSPKKKNRDNWMVTLFFITTIIMFFVVSHLTK